MIDELRKLAECDRKIFLVRRRLAEIPEADRKGAREIEGLAAELEAEGRKTRELEVSQKEAELDIESREEEIRKKQNRLLEVKTNRDYAALTSEIGRLREEISALEEKALSLLDAISAGKEAHRGRAAAFATREKASREARSALSAEEKKLRAELDGLEAVRPALAGKVPPEARGTYERILASRRDGQAMVRLVEGNCGGCLTRVATSAREQARRRERLVCCEHCNRIIFFEEEG